MRKIIAPCSRICHQKPPRGFRKYNGKIYYRVTYVFDNKTWFDIIP
ncbi:MAG: hypothetical protein WC631_01045 [Candidatus Paceibacterota bacterium]